MTTGRFDDHVALITGGASGIGAATGRRLAAEGASVVLADVDAAALERTVADLNVDGLEVVGIPCDQSSRDDVESLFERLGESYDRLDVCFANAGIGRVGPFLDVPVELWQRMLDVNVTGTFHVCQTAARRMATLGSGGSIVVTSSAGAIRPEPLMSAYCTGKAALNMLVAVMAYELGPLGVRVNAVMPGVTETSMTEALRDAGGAEMVKAETPLGRLGRPEEIAGAVAFLASPDASYVTGTTLLIDGGGSWHVPGWFSTDFRISGEPQWQLRRVAPAVEHV